MQPVLQLKDIVKTFPGVMALKGVSMEIYPGEVCGLVGENGAGKSTLVKIISGIYKADSGEIRIDGGVVHINSSAEAGMHGIQVMHQDRKNFPNMTVAENLLISQLPHRYGFINKNLMLERSGKLLEHVGLGGLDLNSRMGDLSIAVQQMVDLARVLSTDPKVVLFDEPTAALSKKDVEKLFGIIRDLKSRGVAIIYISHYLDEVLDICDTVHILRDGNHVGAFPANELTTEQVIEHMIGQKRKPLSFDGRKPRGSGREVLKVEALTSLPKLNRIDLTLYSGEILGLYGTVGAGKTECLRAIYGLDPIDQGIVSINGKTLTRRSVQTSLAHGMVLVPEDRKRQALVLSSSVRKNATLGLEQLFERFGWIRFGKEKNTVKHYVDELKIKTPTTEVEVGTLSGGNQQKVVLSRSMLRKANIYLLDEPTVGIDVGARFEIYRLIRQLADSGASIIVASSEISEIMEICDRIVVLRQGRVTAELDRDEATEDNLLLHAVGGV